MSLLRSLEGAELIVVDDELVYAWFGGNGVNVYNEAGDEVDYFSISSRTGRLSPSAVRAAIERVRQEAVEDEDEGDAW
jgi:hypothetical protein